MTLAGLFPVLTFHFQACLAPSQGRGGGDLGPQATSVVPSLFLRLLFPFCCLPMSPLPHCVGAFRGQAVAVWSVAWTSELPLQ